MCWASSICLRPAVWDAPFSTTFPSSIWRLAKVVGIRRSGGLRYMNAQKWYVLSSSRQSKFVSKFFTQKLSQVSTRRNKFSDLNDLWYIDCFCQRARDSSYSNCRTNFKFPHWLQCRQWRWARPILCIRVMKLPMDNSFLTPGIGSSKAEIKGWVGFFWRHRLNDMLSATHTQHCKITEPI